MWIFWWPGTELGPVEGLNHMPLVLQLGVDGHYDSVSVDPGHCALGLSKGTRIPVWSLSAPAQDNILLMRMIWQGWSRTRM